MQKKSLLEVAEKNFYVTESAILRGTFIECVEGLTHVQIERRKNKIMEFLLLNPKYIKPVIPVYSATVLHYSGRYLYKDDNGTYFELDKFEYVANSNIVEKDDSLIIVTIEDDRVQNNPFSDKWWEQYLVGLYQKEIGTHLNTIERILKYNHTNVDALVSKAFDLYDGSRSKTQVLKELEVEIERFKIPKNDSGKKFTPDELKKYFFANSSFHITTGKTTDNKSQHWNTMEAQMALLTTRVSYNEMVNIIKANYKTIVGMIFNKLKKSSRYADQVPYLTVNRAVVTRQFDLIVYLGYKGDVLNEN